MTRRDLSGVLKPGTPRAALHAKLGPPEASVAVPPGRHAPAGYGSLTRRKLQVTKIDTWPIDGYTRLSRTESTSVLKPGEWLVEEVIAAPLIMNWAAKQKAAQYRLHVGYGSDDTCSGHSRVLVDGKPLGHYPPLEN